MAEVKVFAPGKLMVIGEYAVLHGERALVAAVDSGIECRSTPRPGGWWLTAPDLGVDAALPDAAALPGAALLAAATEQGARAYGLGPHHLLVRGRGPGAHRKTGLGGSAAATVALLGCLAAASGRGPTHPAVRGELFDLAFQVHRVHQRGRGSGADVAASVFGGWLDYTLAQDAPRIQRAAVPPGLLLAAAWSGASTDTATSLAAFDRMPDGPELLTRMRMTLSDFWTAMAAGSGTQILQALAAYGDLLNHTAAGLGAPGGMRIARLVRAAGDRGTAAKGSGAVGGDCVIALGDAARLRAARAAWRKLGAAVLDVATDPHGVRVLDSAA